MYLKKMHPTEKRIKSFSIFVFGSTCINTDITLALASLMKSDKIAFLENKKRYNLAQTRVVSTFIQMN